MKDIDYGYAKNMGQIDFAAAEEKVVAALKTEGFGVLTEIDVKATLKKKIDVDFRKYKILGACNPQLAHGVLQTELSAGLFLPCSVVIYEDDEANQNVMIGKPSVMFAPVPNSDIKGMLAEVDARIERIMASL
jgi:uncharacterized protein (DUF302 family)